MDNEQKVNVEVVEPLEIKNVELQETNNPQISISEETPAIDVKYEKEPQILEEETPQDDTKMETIDLKPIDTRETVHVETKLLKGKLKRTKSRVEVDISSVEEANPEKTQAYISAQEKVRITVNNGLEKFVPKQEEKTKSSFQTIYINDRAANKKQWWFWPSNYLRTTRYTFITFIPLNLFEQFRRLSNLYFLITMIITLIPGVSPVFPITSILPLVIILSITAVKDAIEDLVRWRDDLRVNNVKFEVIRNGKIHKIPSKSIEIGDIVIVNKNQDFPSDLLLLSCSNNDGIAFVETAK